MLRPLSPGPPKLAGIAAPSSPALDRLESAQLPSRFDRQWILGPDCFFEQRQRLFVRLDRLPILAPSLIQRAQAHPRGSQFGMFRSEGLFFHRGRLLVEGFGFIE